MNKINETYNIEMQKIATKLHSSRFKDKNGKSIQEKSYVKVNVPLWLLQDLPEEDQDAIISAAKNPMLVSELMYEYKEDDIELEFCDDKNNIHWIYLAGKYLENM